MAKQKTIKVTSNESKTKGIPVLIFLCQGKNT
jgi:hypothetical protein